MPLDLNVRVCVRLCVVANISLIHYAASGEKDEMRRRNREEDLFEAVMEGCGSVEERAEVKEG